MEESRISQPADVFQPTLTSGNAIRQPDCKFRFSRVVCFSLMKAKSQIPEVLKNRLGATESSVELPQGVAVTHLPPVFGEETFAANAPGEAKMNQAGTVTLTRQPIDVAMIIANARQGEDGAVVVFDGIVRNETHGRQTLYLDYEAYEEMALRQMDELARHARSRFGVRHVTLVHRLGRLQVGECSVLIVVAWAHRGQAFGGWRWLIDTLKKTVPIWKKETFVDGAVWAAGEPFPEGTAANGTAIADESSKPSGD